MKLSIIVPVLNSHEIVRRSLLYYDKMDLPYNVEILYIDDGSDPPITGECKGLTIYQTNDSREWTWALARNFGAKKAKGEYLLMCDLDYIIPKDVILNCLEFTKDYRGFRREFGVLDEAGKFVQTIESLSQWGWPKERYETRGFELPTHPNDFLIKRDVFFEMGMYREDLVEKPYPQGEDRFFKKKGCSGIAKVS